MPFGTGPAPRSQWTVHDDHVSFVRAPQAQRVVRFAATPKTLEVDLSSSALIVVDMQNDFCHPEGWFGLRGVDLAPIRRPIPAIARIAPVLRKAGALVIWLHWGIRPDRANLPAGVLYRGKRQPDQTGYGDVPERGRGAALVQGSWGAARIDELTGDPADLLVHKHRLSGFCDNELDSILRRRSISTLFFAGINTDRCVFSSLQDAAELGYDCVLLEDACGTPSPDYVRDGVLYLVREMHGFTATSTDLIACMDRHA